MTIALSLAPAAHAAEAHAPSVENPDKVKQLQVLWDEWNQPNVPSLWTKDYKDEAPSIGSGKPKKK